ncbi:hypothetical protein P3T73_04600 [Kiritimatiellota bacterium B12222]|nr:hypothetical protein P3T73_04600 [Kiritimatiellota bacterium B12222]
MHSRFIKISFWVLGSLTLLGCVAYWGLFVLPQNKINDVEAQMEAQGVPMRLVDLAPEAVPEELNAAPLYLEAYHLLESLTLEGENLFYYKTGYGVEKVGEERLEGLLTLLADPVYAQAMALIDEATQLPYCQFDLNYHLEAHEIFVPHVTWLMGLSSLLHVQLEVKLERGDASELTNSLARLNGLALRLGDEPITISQLVRIANIAIYTDALAYALSMTEPSVEFLQEVQRQLSRFPEEVIHSGWMTGERIFYLDYGQSGNYYDENGIGITDIWDNSSSLSEGMMCLTAALVPVWDKLYYYEHMLEVESTFAVPYAQIDWVQYEQRLAEVPDPFFFSADALDMRQLLESMPKAKVKVQLAKVAVALHQIRLETGAFPDELSEHTQLDLIDPFVARPFQYEKTEEGFRLYSVGPNQTDDGGVKERKSRKDDLLWSYPYMKQ